MLTFQNNNVFASLDCSWSRNKGYPTWRDVTLEIIGTKGTLSVDAFAQKTDIYYDNGTECEFWGDNMDEYLIRDFSF